jgi:hypothetical protein
VATVVEKASEPDKSLEWRERKQHTIDRAAAEDDLDALAVIAADKLDNVRSLQETLRALGEAEAWKIFNAPRKCQHWYYRELALVLLERQPTNLLFRTLDAFRIFDNPFIQTRGANGTETVSILGYNTLINRVNLGLGSAVSVLIFIAVIIIAALFIKGLGTSTAQQTGEA